MKATFAELMSEGLVSCRGVMGLCPRGAENSLQVRAFTATMEAAAAPGPAASGSAAHWFRLVDQGKESYVCWRDDHTGAFVNSVEKMRSDGIDPSGLPVLEIDPARQVVPSSVAAFRARLMAALEADQGADAGAEKGDGFTQDERQKLTVLGQCLGMVLDACGEGYTDKMTADGLQTLTQVFSPAGGASVTLADRLEALEQMKRKALQIRAFFAADVYLAARLSLFPSLLTAIATRMKGADTEEFQIVLQMTRFFFTTYSEGVSRPARLIPSLVEKMSREGYGDLVEALAKSCAAAGVSAIEAALNCKDLDDYGGHLYAATHDCFAASHLYELLDADTERRAATPGGAWWAQSSKVAEEKLVRCTNALFRLVFDPFQGSLNRHRERVAAAYQSGGEDARNAVINDLIENNYFYPRCFEKRLAGEA